MLADIILNATWNRMYFTTGLPIFIMRVPVNSQHTGIPHNSIRLSADIQPNTPDYSRLKEEFQSDLVGSLTFKEIDTNKFGFREKLIQFRLMRYSPLMHGLLIFDNDNSQVIVKGFINWFPLCLSLVWLIPVITSSDHIISLGFIVFFILVMGLIYGIQSSRFIKVATFAAQAWSGQ
jgi:hypothetical protein